MSDDWLSLPTPDPDAVVAEVLFDEVTPRIRDATAPPGMPAVQGNLIAALRQLSWRQRVYLRAFIEGGCTKRGAKRVLRERGKADTAPNDSTVHHWQHNAVYVNALNQLKRYAVDAAGLDRDSVLIKTGQVLEEAMTPRAVYRDSPDGDKEILAYTEEIDGNVAMRAIEFAGKVNKMIGSDDTGTRVTLTIVNIASRDEPDVTQGVVAEQ